MSNEIRNGSLISLINKINNFIKPYLLRISNKPAMDMVKTHTYNLIMIIYVCKPGLKRIKGYSPAVNSARE